MSRTHKMNRKRRKRRLRYLTHLQRCARTGKACHSNAHSAKRHQAELDARQEEFADEGESAVYLCPFCNYYHVGHTRKPKGTR